MKNKNKKNIIRQKSKKPSRLGAFCLVNKILVGLIIVSGVYYVIGVNDLSIKGFMLEDLKRQSESLAKENQDIEIKVMQLESYEHLAAKAQELKMVAVDKIEYITIVNGEVAKK